MKWNLAPLIATHPHYDAPARRAHAHVHLLPPKRLPKEDKENIHRSTAGLRSYGSVQQLKPLERALEKGQSLRTLVVDENKPVDLKKRKHSIGTTLKPLQEKYVCSVPVVESEDEECF
jgi:hypothetical protein